MVGDRPEAAGERAFDVASLIRDRRPMLAQSGDMRAIMQRRLEQLTGELSLDRDRILAWAVAQTVHLGTWALSVDERTEGELEIACGRVLASLVSRGGAAG